METQPQLRSGFKKINSLHRRLESWLYNYQGTLPIDAQLCFEQLGLEYNNKNYTKFYHALWEINKAVDAKVSFTLKDFYFTGIPTEKEVTSDDAMKITYDRCSNSLSFNGVKAGDFIEKVPSPFDVLQDCYKQLAQLPKEERTKILQSLTIML